MAVDEVGSITIIDFGCAKYAPDLETEVDIEPEELMKKGSGYTMTGQKGTPGYWPPEFYIKHGASKRTMKTKINPFAHDVFALGCLIYEMLFLTVPEINMEGEDVRVTAE